MTPEAEVMAYIRDFFKWDRGIYISRNNIGAIKRREGRFVRFGSPGESDWRGVIDKTFCPYCGEQTGTGIALFIEAKSAKGRLSPEQKEFLGRMDRLGAIAIVAKPVPAPDDPTGFKALRRQLERIRDRACPECEKARKTEKKEDKEKKRNRQKG